MPWIQYVTIAVVNAFATAQSQNSMI